MTTHYFTDDPAHGTAPTETACGLIDKQNGTRHPCDDPRVGGACVTCKNCLRTAIFTYHGRFRTRPIYQAA